MQIFAQAKNDNLEANHQYSKSFEFENDFRDYIKNFVVEGIEYFSLLRPYYEIKIAQMFAAYTKEKPDYLKVFTSCNANF